MIIILILTTGLSTKYTCRGNIKLNVSSNYTLPNFVSNCQITGHFMAENGAIPTVTTGHTAAAAHLFKLTLKIILKHCM